METVRCEELQLELSSAMRARGTTTTATWSTQVSQPASEIERIMAKIEQDNRILAELEHSRSTTHGTLIYVIIITNNENIVLFNYQVKTINHVIKASLNFVSQVYNRVDQTRRLENFIRQHRRLYLIRIPAQATQPSARVTPCPPCPLFMPHLSSLPLALTPWPTL